VLAPGIALLADVCATVGRSRSSPDREQSGTSHSLTLHPPLRRAIAARTGAFQVDGTPTAAFLLASGAHADAPTGCFSV